MTNLVADSLPNRSSSTAPATDGRSVCYRRQSAYREHESLGASYVASGEGTCAADRYPNPGPGHPLPKSAAGKAANYTLARWNKLTRFLEYNSAQSSFPRLLDSKEWFEDFGQRVLRAPWTIVPNADRRDALSKSECHINFSLLRRISNCIARYILYGAAK